MSEVEFFDDFYSKYLERHAFINGVVASFIIVEWEKEPSQTIEKWGREGLDGRVCGHWSVRESAFGRSVCLSSGRARGRQFDNL